MANFRKVDWKETAIQVAGTFLGIAAGGTAQKYLSDSKAISGLGSGTVVADYVVPTVILGAGAFCSASAKSSFLKSFGFGVTAVGGAKIVNQVAGKELVSLSASKVSEQSNTNNLAVVETNLGRLGRTNRIPRRVPSRLWTNTSKTAGVGSAELMPGIGTVKGVGSAQTVLTPGCGGLL